MVCSVKKYGLIGSSLGHSCSPYIHNHFFKIHNLNSVYELFEVDEHQLSDILISLRKKELHGLNVTFPYKEMTLPFLDNLHKSAVSTGAVNTIQNMNGTLTGYNTDVYGIISTLHSRLKIPVRDRTVIVLGAGGAARACLTALAPLAPAKIIIFNRTLSRIESIVNEFRGVLKEIDIERRNLEDLNSSVFSNDCSIIINSISDEESVCSALYKCINGHQVVDIGFFDLNYGDKALPQDIRQCFRLYEDGLYMLSAQAAESFRIWTSLKLNPDSIYNYFHERKTRDNLC